MSAPSLRAVLPVCALMLSACDTPGSPTGTVGSRFSLSAAPTVIALRGDSTAEQAWPSIALRSAARGDSEPLRLLMRESASARLQQRLGVPARFEATAWSPSLTPLTNSSTIGFRADKRVYHPSLVQARAAL